tara:strand:+ start:2631 stop:3095 length:465 start_codon:yes stop_codon:yes gene_type:complete
MIIWTSTMSIFLFRYIFKDFNADLRYIIFGSCFPILLDRILYLFSISENLISIGHSLFVTIALLFSLMITTKRNSILRNNALLFSIGSFLYLALSFTWLNQEIFLYPIFSDTDDLFEISLIFKFVLNIIGLIYFFYKTKNFENLKLFIKKGQFI